MTVSKTVIFQFTLLNMLHSRVAYPTGEGHAETDGRKSGANA